ncbi:hypothetical protein GCM10011519_07930 [Marmoricola endophyticus]|uniref:Uncharacterized protein n=1 Tax=Marmoricola endophyticus TaxID=2040280 RepID=A0A917BC37_9ACTN|nr:hypothetical protein [Marmoricola endophyticus]GGF36784.1 hypothetical protein GCM10011519_07930 [Marmoricola endophyticus]
MIGTTGIDERPRDPENGAPVPFVCEYDDGRASVRLLNKKRVTQCALSRICGVCGDSLGRPVAFVGPLAEANREAFHFPPVHVECGRALVATTGDAPYGVLGQDDATASWVMVTTGGFDHDRPQPGELDRRPTFRPNSVLETVPL